ncbi:hypothetical protein B0H13DRAFT_2278945 [Mycena leptocephala]|nr:hypothetical protein B0H13DRAFT_2278945 [Mycena leptocephala]
MVDRDGTAGERASTGQMRSQAPGAEARDVRLPESSVVCREGVDDGGQTDIIEERGVRDSVDVQRRWGGAVRGSGADECAVAKWGRRVARTMPRVASMRWRRSGAATAASGDAVQVREVDGVASNRFGEPECAYPFVGARSYTEEGVMRGGGGGGAGSAQVECVGPRGGRCARHRWAGRRRVRTRWLRKKSNVGSGGGGAPKTKGVWPSVRRWSRRERRDSTPLGSISAELALRSGMRDDVVVNEDVVQLPAVFREDRTRLDGARAPSQDGSAPSAWMLAWPFVGKVSGRMLVTVSIKYCPKTAGKYDMSVIPPSASIGRHEVPAVDARPAAAAYLAALLAPFPPPTTRSDVAPRQHCRPESASGRCWHQPHLDPEIGLEADGEGTVDGTGCTRRGEPRKAAGVEWDGTGRAAHGERAQQQRGASKGRARGVEAAARRDGTGVAARTPAGAQGHAMRTEFLGRERHSRRRAGGWETGVVARTRAGPQGRAMRTQSLGMEGEAHGGAGGRSGQEG